MHSHPLLTSISLFLWVYEAILPKEEKRGGKEGYACMQAYVNNNIILLIKGINKKISTVSVVQSQSL